VRRQRRGAVFALVDAKASAHDGRTGGAQWPAGCGRSRRRGRRVRAGHDPPWRACAAAAPTRCAASAGRGQGGRTYLVVVVVMVMGDDVLLLLLAAGVGGCARGGTKPTR
jgi:hypothetical protein